MVSWVMVPQKIFTSSSMEPVNMAKHGKDAADVINKVKDLEMGKLSCITSMDAT